MSTILNTNGAELKVPTVDHRVRGKFYIFTADWNQKITYALRDAAVDVLLKGGVERGQIELRQVPGTVELVNAAAAAVERPGRPGNSDPSATEAAIVIGCVIRGDTPHFDYVCQIAAQGTAQLNALGKAPVIFGVLTVDNERQALERAGGALGNKGAEAAVAAIEMANLHAAI